MELNTRDKLVTWFCQNYKPIVDEMKNISHFPDHRTDHPFHGEGSIWTHTMMVMTHIQCDQILTSEQKQILLTVGLLHDIGKVEAHQIKDNGDKFSFEGHEGLSFYKSIDILDIMEKYDDFYTNDRKLKILKAISLHGTGILFDESSEDYFYTYRFRIADKEGAVRNVDENIFSQYPKRKVSNRKNIDIEKTLVLMVGLPGAGKTTYVNENFKDYFIISRDDYMEKFYYLRNGANTKTYNEIYKWINLEENTTSFNNLFDKMVNQSTKLYNKIVIDMTMLTAGKRRNMLNRFSKFTAECVCLISGESEIHRVNEIRNLSDRDISDYRFHALKKKFILPTKEEGFDNVIIKFR